jgi:hypothetical protein
LALPTDKQPRFGATDVIQISSKLTLDDDTFLVGGQATNLWAWYYQDKSDLLSPSKPLTSQDIDYFGTFKAAQIFAEALGGKAHKPSKDTMNTPSTALVIAKWDGQDLEIDFLNGVLGVSKRELENGISVLRVSAQVDGLEKEADIALMHPILCLKSRVANMLSPATKRRDEIAWAQLHASIEIVKAYIEDSLESDDWEEAKNCIQSLCSYLKSSIYGRQVDSELGVDLIEILRHFHGHERIDDRFLELTLAPEIERLTEKSLARKRKKFG